MIQSKPTFPFETDRPYSIPRVGALESVRRHKLLFLLPLLLLTGLGAFYGLGRSPTYTAESRQAVGRIDVNQPGALSGFAAATGALAETYSRAIGADAVVNDVARQTRLPPSVVERRLSATPVPDSPVFRVVGTGDSPQQAIATANSGAAALRNYAERVNERNPNATRLSKKFEQVSLLAAQRRNDVDAIKERIAGSVDATETDKLELAQAEARLDSAKLDVDVVKRNYTASQQSQSNTAMIQTLTKPSRTTSDRFSVLQISLFAGICLGLLMGVALATYKANRDVRRFITAG